MMDFSVDNQLNVRSRSRLFIYILLGIIIIISGDTLLFGTNSNSMMINIKYFVHVALFAGLSMLTLLKNIKINKNALFVYLVLIFIILLSGIINNELSFGYYYKILIITLSLLITTFIPLNTFILYYDKIIIYLASLSLLGYGTYQLFNGIVRFFPTITNTANREFYNLFITYIPNYGYGGVLIRNWGIFREPGVFQMYLILGLLAQLFILKRPKLFSIIVYIITIITTFSTTAYIALLIIIGAYFITKNKNSKHMKRVLFTFIILSAILIVFLYTEQFNLYINSVFGKLEDFSHRSTAARFASITVNIRVIFENPLLGIGFNNLAEVFPYYALQRTGFLVEDNTNMILIQFASHGIIYGSLWVLGYWKTSRKMAYNLKKKNSKSALFFIVFMILFVGANLTWGFITYVLLFYGYISYSNEFRNDISSGKLDSKMTCPPILVPVRELVEI